MKLLLLGGTAEARELADMIVARNGIELTVSLAGATRTPETRGRRTRIGGFGGAEGFTAFLKSEAPDAVLDATHPFAVRMTRRTHHVCDAHALPYKLLLRPEWKRQTGDNWTEVRDEAEAVAWVTPSDRVFLATGRQTLPRFAQMRAAYTWCRQIDPPDGPYPFKNGEFLVGRPPFSVEDEIDLFSRLGVTVLIVKQAGGAASRTKLDAARALQIPVLLIKRPDYSGISSVETVQDAVKWIDSLTHANHSL